MARPTLFRLLLLERRWDTWAIFCPHFEARARALAEETANPRLAHVTVGRKTFDRWFCGNWYGRPWKDTGRVLEALLGFPLNELFSPAPDVMSAKMAPHDRGGVQASLAISRRWPTSRLFLSAADDVADSWEWLGREVLDGTTAAVQFLPVSRNGEGVTLRTEHVTSLRGFLRPARRGLLVGVDEGHDDDLRLFVIDSANARRALSAPTAGDGTLALPAAYVLDDLTYGILWSLVQLDDGLLADDQTLDAEQQVLDTYLSLPRSAVSQLSQPTLTSVGARWLGSAFCARHIHRRLDRAAEPPVFWTRERTGEEAALWLFFGHKIAYLKSLADRYAHAARPLSRVFCIPENEVQGASPYERILLFLAISLMEMLGIHVRVTTQPEYTSMDGFALVPGQSAVVANWVRTDALWQVDTTTSSPDLRTYRDAFTDASNRSVMAGPEPETRLRLLADYLRLDWPWLIPRCRDLGDCGVAGIIRPRSRLISVDALDAVLRFLGSLAPRR
ncbi:hypothetical protein [Streptomyces sp. SBT349]|uniref:hypothetical protein n=1 Tax=Streptomyces sp. SBT349 TaxID=1580539 RepID=UPI00066E352E|nr:hypothetical protein [Streptomyces sp. SBT349]